jgi:gamma-glutamyltranspeptidase
MFHPLFRKGKALSVGDIYTRPEMARTLDLLAENGAGSFYEGEIALGIVKAVQANGGRMTLDDLESESVC